MYLTKHQREYIERLNRRKEFLEHRVEGRQDLSYDRAELGALIWAIDTLIALHDEPEDIEIKLS